MEKNLKYNNNKLSFKIFFNNKVDEIKISNDATVPEINKLIYNKYLLNHFNYSIMYHNKKLTLNDLNRVSYYFDKDPNPFLFIIDNRLISHNCDQSRSVFLTTNLTEKQIYELVSNFFEIIGIPFNVNIKLLKNNKYRIRFTRPIYANEFMQYYNILQVKEVKNKIEMGLRLPKIRLKKSISYRLIEKNSIENALKNVIKQNNKDSFITEKTVNSGMDIYHPSFLKSYNRKSQSLNVSKHKIKIVKYNYKGIFKLPFLNPDQRYNREKFLDKKNWMDKKGFIVSIGNYKMGGDGNSFISNYVSATPSNSPLNHNFREVNKDKWVNKKGFFL